MFFGKACYIIIVKELKDRGKQDILQKATFRVARDGLLACKTWPFAARKTAFRKAAWAWRAGACGVRVVAMRVFGLKYGVKAYSSCRFLRDYC